MEDLPSSPQGEPALKRIKTDLPNNTDEYNEVLRLLDQQLEEHDQNRRNEQEKLLSICEELRKQIDEMEDAINNEFEEKFTKEDKRLQDARHELHLVRPGEVSDAVLKKAIQKAKAELVLKQFYKIRLASKFSHNKVIISTKNNKYVMRLGGDAIGNDSDENSDNDDDENDDVFDDNDSDDDDDDENDDVFGDNDSDDDDDDDDNDDSDDDDNNNVDVVDVDSDDNDVNENDENDNDNINENNNNDDVNDDNKENESVQQNKKKIELNRANKYGLYTTREVSSSFLKLELPEKIKVTGVYEGRVYLEIPRNNDIERVFNENGFENDINYAILIYREKDECTKYVLRNEEGNIFSFLHYDLVAEMEYTVEIELQFMEIVLVCSEPKEIKMPKFSECFGWRTFEKAKKESLEDINEYKRILTGSAAIPLRKEFSWNISISNSKENDGRNIGIGIGNSLKTYDNRIHGSLFYAYKMHGWYFNCYDSTLNSGHPHKYNHKEYGPRKEKGNYVHTGDSIGVVMNTTRGDLSFVINGVNLGVAFEGIPLDKPLFPCVILENGVDSVELDFSDVKEKRNEATPTPTYLRVENNLSWDSLSLKWNAVDNVSFYQIEMNGNKLPDAPKENYFTKFGLLPDTEYIFRVRGVFGSEVGRWSNYIVGSTQKKEFKNIGWENCSKGNDYFLSKDNMRIVTSNSFNSCIIRGNMPLPRNKVTSWSINILDSKDVGRNRIYVGVCQNKSDYGGRCPAWYFCCLSRELCSNGHNENDNLQYGPSKEECECISSVGVIMDMVKGKLSFMVNGVGYGVAYENIPRNVDIFPCVILGNKGNTVELVPCEVKENVSEIIPVTKRIWVTKNTLKTAEITWDAIDGTTLYQLDVNGSINQLTSSNTFTVKWPEPDTEQRFRLRSVRGNWVSKWSDVFKWRSQKRIFENSMWKECPRGISDERKYSVNEVNPRIAEKTNPNKHNTTIIGEVSIPNGKITSWDIKILKSSYDTSSGIYVGVAPCNIRQGSGSNHINCGWYYYCYDSKLYSGPPHKYDKKEYGPRKSPGKNVRTGDTVGVVMDTTKGKLSFVLNEVNYGVAYEGIPLDNPLVPCVILCWGGDSVELII